MDHEGLDSEGDGTSPLPSADETNLTIVADEFDRAHEGALIEFDISPPDPIEVGQAQGRIINPRLDQHSNANIPAISIPNRGRRQPDQGTMRVARE